MKIESSQLSSYEDAPWLEENIEYENEDYVVYKDGYPVTEGHLLFVPKNKDKRSNVTDCFQYAYDWGVKGVCNYEYGGLMWELTKMKSQDNQ